MALRSLIIRRSLIITLLLCFFAIMVHCVADSGSQGQKTPTEKLAYMYQIYNAQHEDYMVMSGRPDLTEEQREILGKKKNVLEILQTLIPAYDMQVQLGSPTYEREQEIYNLLTDLQNMAIQ
jgi:hypothetical protein